MSADLDLLPTRRLVLRYGLLASAWLLSPTMGLAQSLTFPGPGGGVAPTITAALYIDMNVGAANGTVIDTTMLAAGSHENGTLVNVWFLQCSGPCGMTVEGAAGPLPTPIRVGSTVYGLNTPARVMQMDHGQAFDYLSFAFKAGFTTASMGAFITFGPSNQGGASQLWDYIRFKGVSTGQFVVLQLNNGSGGGGYGVNVETNPGGVTTHSTRIDLTPGGRYWCTMRCNFVSGIADLAVFAPATWTLVGQVSTTQTTGETIGELQFGQGEEGLLPGVVSTFEHLVVDSATARFPLGPLGSV